MKVFEFNLGLADEKEWIMAPDVEAAKACLLEMSEDFQDDLDHEQTSIKELSETEMKEIQIIDLEDETSDDPITNSLFFLFEKEKGSNESSSLGSTNY